MGTRKSFGESVSNCEETRIKKKDSCKLSARPLPSLRFCWLNSLSSTRSVELSHPDTNPERCFLQASGVNSCSINAGSSFTNGAEGCRIC